MLPLLLNIYEHLFFWGGLADISIPLLVAVRRRTVFSEMGLFGPGTMGHYSMLLNSPGAGWTGDSGTDCAGRPPSLWPAGGLSFPRNTPPPNP